MKETVEAIKSGTEPDLNRPLAAATEIKLHLPALLEPLGEPQQCRNGDYGLAG